MIEDSNLLFSICVLTFNSEATIIETLESVKDIEYSNIELIISDDCSKDCTIDLCTQWLNENSSRFRSSRILTVDENTYTSANCNRALKHSTGDWVCLIAGDDVLYSNSISKIVDFITNNPECEWIVGKYNRFHTRCVPENFYKEGPEFNDIWKSLFDLDCKGQFRHILEKNFIFLPTAFCKRQSLLKIGGYDEKYGVLEDYPMNIKLLKNGIRCYLLDDYIMGYRTGLTNVCNNSSKLFNINHMRLRYNVVCDYCFCYYSKYKRYNEIAKLSVYNFFYMIGADKRNYVNEFLLKSTLKIINLLFKGKIVINSD